MYNIKVSTKLSKASMLFSALIAILLNLAALKVILQREAMWATLRLAREIWRINQSCEVLTKSRRNVQPL
jgi:hypothetical protein